MILCIVYCELIREFRILLFIKGVIQLFGLYSIIPNYWFMLKVISIKLSSLIIYEYFNYTFLARQNDGDKFIIVQHKLIYLKNNS